MSDQNAARNSQMDSEIETVAQRVSSVADLVDNLKVRLGPVLRDEGSPPLAESKDAEQALVSHAQRLRSVNRMATKTIEELEHILAVLEV